MRTAQATEFWAQARGSDAGAWVRDYWASSTRPYRQQIVDVVRTVGPIASVLEVGCHCGPNLRLLATALPDVTCAGVDVNREAIEGGKALMQRAGLGDRVRLFQAAFPGQTAVLAAGSFDVVVTCYTLAYLSSAQLPAALWELGRIAARAVVIAEPMPDPLQRAGEYRRSGYVEWVHDYAAAAGWIQTLAGATVERQALGTREGRLNAICVVRK